MEIDANDIAYAGRTAIAIGARDLSRQVAHLAQGGTTHCINRK